jgi:hypothetical protein
VSESTASGACLCEAVQFELKLPSNWVAHCHCSMCRRAHGAPYVTWISVPRDRFEVKAGAEQLSSYRSSADSVRRFCKICGSSLVFESDRWPGEVHISRANIPGPVDREPGVHAFFSDKADWVRVEDSLPRRGGTSGVEPLPR